MDVFIWIMCMFLFILLIVVPFIIMLFDYDDKYSKDNPDGVGSFYEISHRKTKRGDDEQ